MPKLKLLRSTDDPTLKNLPDSDGEPLETLWHSTQMSLLTELAYNRWPERTDVLAGGNCFFYFDPAQAKSNNFRGPDFWVAKGVDAGRLRQYWAVWDEDGRVPNLIVELLSPSTADIDLKDKKAIYESLGVSEYFCAGVDGWLVGWRLNARDEFEPITAEENGRLWSHELECYLEFRLSRYHRTERLYLRLYTVDGIQIPTGEERSEMQTRRAQFERQQSQAERLRNKELTDTLTDAKIDQQLAKSQLEQERIRSTTEHHRAETERLRADAERERADAASRQAEAEKQRAETEKQRAEAEALRAESEKQSAIAARKRADQEATLRMELDAELARLRSRIEPQ